MSEALQTPPSWSMAVPGFVLTPQELRPAEHGIAYETWAAVGETLRRMEGAIQFWIADWLLYGESAYGESCSQAIDACDWNEGTLTQYAWVAERVPATRRHPLLTFSHHREVADLPEREQVTWLTRAAEGDDGHRWSVNRLRRELNASKRGKTEVWLSVACAHEMDRDELASRLAAEGRKVVKRG